MTTLPRPHPYTDFGGLLQIAVCYDDVVLNSQQPCGPITLPDCPVDPRVLCQAVDKGRNPLGPTYTYDYEADKGRGVWVQFDSDIHDIPRTETDTETDTEMDTEMDTETDTEMDTEMDTETYTYSGE